MLLRGHNEVAASDEIASRISRVSSINSARSRLKASILNEIDAKMSYRAAFVLMLACFVYGAASTRSRGESFLSFTSLFENRSISCRVI